MRRRLLFSLAMAFASSPQAASAVAWISVPTPARSGLSALTCLSTRWCEAIGGWQEHLTAARWNGSRWLAEPNPTSPPRYGALFGLTCSSRRSCMAVGERAKRSLSPYMPLIERWRGSRWSLQSAPSAPAPSGYRYTNSRLKAIACPSSSLCFAVGQAVAFGAGGAPGVPLIERWNGRRWRLAASPPATGPLTAISCTSTRACTAVGGFEESVGPPDSNQSQVSGSVVERWDGRTWSLQSLTTPAGDMGAVPLGISCTSSAACTTVGSALNPQPPQYGSSFSVDEAMVGDWSGTAWSSQSLSYPPAAYRSPSTQTPHTSLTAVACQTSASCAAVGTYAASNGALGPLAAVWNGSTWRQTIFTRGQQLTSVACPALGWCMAVGGSIAELLR